MRWWKLAGVSIAGLLALAAATWAVFWVHPPEAAYLVTLVAGYDNTLAVPANPYGKAAAREMAELTKPGGWLGTQSRLRGAARPARLSRLGLPELAASREKCIVVAVAAHGGRDRDGAFLFPEDTDSDPAARVRIKTLIDQLARLPADKHKLLILDATEPAAYTDLGLVHNDFASAVEELESAIAAAPNCVVFMSSGPDQRSWTSPEWGMSSFWRHVKTGLLGAADANGDKRISGLELVDYVLPRVHDWARDHRSALQMPVILPRGEAGRSRLAEMHLAMTDGPPPEEGAPTAFEPPPELEQAWREYQELSLGYPPPTAYCPHLWRQFEAWTLRFEDAIIAGDADGAKHARTQADELKRRIEAARRLEIGPQTLSLAQGLGGLQVPTVAPDAIASGIKQLAATPDVERPAAWAKLRASIALPPETSLLLWCRGLIDWAAVDPLVRLPLTPALAAIVSDGMPVRPAELNLTVMLALNLPPTEKTELIGPLLKRILHQRLAAEEAAVSTSLGSYPFPEWIGRIDLKNLHDADAARRTAEDLCFANRGTDWQEAEAHLERAERGYRDRTAAVSSIHRLIEPWHSATARLPALTEWLASESAVSPLERLPREVLFQAWRGIWANSHELAAALPSLVANPDAAHLTAAKKNREYAAGGLALLNSLLTEQTTKLLEHRPEFDARPRPRSELVAWRQSAANVLSAPPPTGLSPADRSKLVQEYRRVSRQLLVTGLSHPEPLPEVNAATTRERAFSAARRRGLLLVDRLHVISVPFQQPPTPGFPSQLVPLSEQPETPEYRFHHFAFQADGRQSLAEAGSRCGELLASGVNQAKHVTDLANAERWLRIVPAAADVSDAPLDHQRRERVAHLLADQAQRTYLDHWYSEGGVRYYRNAIEHLAADAAKVAGGAPRDLFTRYLADETPFPATPDAPDRIVITDQPNPELRIVFKGQAPPAVAGVSVFWASPQTKAETRVPVPLDSNAEAARLVRPIAPPTTALPRFPTAEKAPVQLTGFFRGRTTEKTIPVEFHRLPDRVIASAPPLESTAIAVRADPRIRARYGYGVGAVAIVLDCSGSMGPVDRKNPLDRGLYPEAMRALLLLLRELPPGTTVNVWVFGQRMPGAKSPEETIQEIQVPVALQFDREQLIKDIEGRIQFLEPWDLSPIVRAVAAARNRIAGYEAPFKSVVLISDGVDTRYDADQKNIKKRSVKDALRAEFASSGVSLSILALPVDKSEAAFQADMRVVTELKPAGQFVPTQPATGLPQHIPDLEARVKDLAAWLRNGLNPRVRYSLEPLGVTSLGADLAAGSETADNWYRGRLEPGTYRFQILGMPEEKHTVRLNRGDRLLLDLEQNRGQIELKRHWYADSAPGVKSGMPTDPWRLNLQQNKSEAGGLRLFTTIEDHPSAIDPLVVSPGGEAWFEVRPVLTQDKPVSARWRPAPGYPAPSWSIDLPGWPEFPGTTGAASPTLEAWWQPGGKFPAAGAWFAPLGLMIASLQGQSSTFGQTRATIESIGVEEHRLDGMAAPERCLAVRIRYPHGNPVWVRPLGATPKGSEVRVYRNADSATCLFWGLDIDKVSGFDVIVLNDALARARSRGFHALLDAIPPPSDNSPRPEPPVDLR
jgi:hypothetical protein